MLCRRRGDRRRPEWAVGLRLAAPPTTPTASSSTRTSGLDGTVAVARRHVRRRSSGSRMLRLPCGMVALRSRTDPRREVMRRSASLVAVAMIAVCLHGSFVRAQAVEQESEKAAVDRACAALQCPLRGYPSTGGTGAADGG